MRQIFLIFILFCFIPKFGFCDRFNLLDSAFRKTTTLFEIKNSFSSFFADTTLTSVGEQINRTIDFNYKQVIYSLRYECFEYDVYLILRNDTIVLGEIQELDYFSEHKIIKSNIFILQTKKIDTYLDRYFSYYKTKVSCQNFIKQMTYSEEYGFACGRGRGHYPEAAKKTQRYVSAKNYKSLSKMLRSVVPEIKAYGARGLMQLEKTGTPMRNNEKIILDHYREQNFKVFSCYGCLSGPDSFNTVLEWDWQENSKSILRKKRATF